MARKQKLTCSKCLGPLEGNRVGRYAYCRKCHAAYMREYRPKYKDLSPDAKLRANARSIARVYLNRGKIERKPCERCGAFDSQMHHEDYSKPLEVTWLCRRCHLVHHGHRPKKGRITKATIN